MRKYPRYRKTTNEINLIILHNILSNGNIPLDRTLEKVIMLKREEIIQKHSEHHHIWPRQSDGRWCTKIGAGKRLIVRKEREDLENAIIEFYLTNEKLAVTVDDVFQNWSQYESSHTFHSMKTINEYSYEYNRFIKETDFASCPIHDVTEKDITRLLTSIVHQDEKIPLKRYKAVKTIIRTLFNHAKIQMELDCIPVKNIMDDLLFPSGAFKQANTENSPQVFKHSETQLLKEALKDTENLLELGILLTLETGVRVGELCALKRDCVTETCLLIRVSEHKAKFGDAYRYYIDTPKKDKIRDIVLNPDAKEVLGRILSLHDSDWLFPNKENPSMWTHAHQFDRAIRRVCRNINIPERSMHKLRKTYTSYALSQMDKDEDKDKRVTDKLVQGQLGHSDIETTHRSYYYDLYDTDERIEILSGIKIG